MRASGRTASIADFRVIAIRSTTPVTRRHAENFPVECWEKHPDAMHALAITLSA